jgi:transcriptional regulator with XRE-family HTH domain
MSGMRQQGAQNAATAPPAPVNKRAPTATDHAVGVQIRLLRRAAGMTLKDLGGVVGVSCVQFQRYETGTSRVSASRLFAISDALGVQVDSLIADRSAHSPEPATRSQRHEMAELTRVFASISDPRHRLAIIALAHSMAAQEVKARDGEAEPTE